MLNNLTKNIKNIVSSRIISRFPPMLTDKIRRLKFNEAKYWEERYINGGNSGIGSYGDLAHYKAKVVNDFIKKHHIQTVLEFGCGDGNQLSLYDIPNYVGLDVSNEAVNLCKDKFRNDKYKTFSTYDINSSNLYLNQADLVISIDVIFHITNNKFFKNYINLLFKNSEKFVIIYSTNFNKKHRSLHQMDREFSSYISKNITNFALISEIKNPYKGERTMSDFYIYQRNRQVYNLD